MSFSVQFSDTKLIYSVDDRLSASLADDDHGELLLDSVVNQADYQSLHRLKSDWRTPDHSIFEVNFKPLGPNLRPDSRRSRG